jgi:hypothetical protein
MGKDLMFWAAVGLTAVASVGLFKWATARLPVPDGLNEYAASL